MKNMFNNCRKCLNHKVIGFVIIAAIALIIFIPNIGVVTLVAAIPFLACALMCGSMAFMMRSKKSD